MKLTLSASLESHGAVVCCDDDCRNAGYPANVLGVPLKTLCKSNECDVNALLRMAGFIYDHQQPSWSRELYWCMAVGQGLIPATTTHDTDGLLLLVGGAKDKFLRYYRQQQVRLLTEPLKKLLFDVDAYGNLRLLSNCDRRLLMPTSIQQMGVLEGMANLVLQKNRCASMANWAEFDAQIIGTLTGIRLDIGSRDNWLHQYSALRDGRASERHNLDVELLRRLHAVIQHLVDFDWIPETYADTSIRRAAGIASIILRALQYNLFYGNYADSSDGFMENAREDRADDLVRRAINEWAPMRCINRLGHLDPHLALVVTDLPFLAEHLGSTRPAGALMPEVNDTIRLLLARVYADAVCQRKYVEKKDNN